MKNKRRWPLLVLARDHVAVLRALCSCFPPKSRIRVDLVLQSQVEGNSIFHLKCDLFQFSFKDFGDIWSKLFSYHLNDILCIDHAISHCVQNVCLGPAVGVVV